jgi:hypothetical protein
MCMCTRLYPVNLTRQIDQFTNLRFTEK